MTGQALTRWWVAGVMTLGLALTGCEPPRGQQPAGGADPKAGMRYNGTAQDFPASVDPGQPGGTSARSGSSGMSGARIPAPATPYSADGSGLVERWKAHPSMRMATTSQTREPGAASAGPQQGR